MPPIRAKEVMVIKAPQPRNVFDTTPGWGELCATQHPECSLAPMPHVAMKSWYNTYVYVPEQRSHDDRQFLQRFVKGPNGDWIDVCKARQMASFLEETQMAALAAEEEREAIRSGEFTQTTHYVDAYSGERMVEFEGVLQPIQQLYDEYGIEEAPAAGADGSASGWFDFDNLRVAWPFGKPMRNKQVSMHTYNYFDRANPQIISDRSVTMVETGSMYMAAEEYRTGVY